MKFLSMLSAAMLLLPCVFAQQPGAVLAKPSVEELRELAQEPHDRRGLMPELEIFPDVRLYEFEMEGGDAEGNNWKTPKIRIKEKVIAGSIVLSTWRIPGAEEDSIMAVTWSAESRCYMKWLVVVVPFPDEIPDDERPKVEVTEFRGVSLEGSDVIAWRSFEREGAARNVGIERQGKDRVDFNDATYLEGKLIQWTKGHAIHLKKGDSE